ncbi:hypothetical protein [Algibacter lectus]|uniref:Uncharacterized protein n=1 Tax=Algibacter lectus TaxID=221126 RepID=A0A4R8MJ69_9FLAO|nr:hypothetical protein [Algibacter lectus]MWW23289.1 hypothetical protein [Algibacter lectus]TDY64036.1 hypothetical protein DFQ06_0935 [Algibacter lectus]
MNKLFSIALSLNILIQSFGICVTDIAQIDEFIEHAQYHSEQYGDNVLVFISKHYGEQKADHDKDHQEEQEEHEQLPFHHQSHVSSVLAFVLNTHKAEFKAVEFLESNTHKFYYQAPSSSLHLEGLFQPPRLS